MIGCVMSDYIIPKRYQQAHNEGIERFLASGQGPVITRRVELAAQHKDGFESRQKTFCFRFAAH